MRNVVWGIVLTLIALFAWQNTTLPARINLWSANSERKSAVLNGEEFCAALGPSLDQRPKQVGDKGVVATSASWSRPFQVEGIPFKYWYPIDDIGLCVKYKQANGRQIIHYRPPTNNLPRGWVPLKLITAAEVSFATIEHEVCVSVLHTGVNGTWRTC